MGNDGQTIEVDSKTKAVFDHKGYVVQKKISEGAFGKVYKAYNRKRNEMDAVKIMDLELMNKKGLSQKYLDREIAALVEVRHPNVLHVNDIFRSRGCLYIFMEFAPGGTLNGKVKEAGFLKERVAQRYFHQCVEALHCMHLEHHMAHRDIKLDNVLLDAHDNCKLSDFGFARTYDPSKELAKTTLGTAPYFAPEVIMHRPYNPFLYDVWSMGVLLFVMLNGKHPFHAQELKTNPRIMLTEMRDKNYKFRSDVDRKLSNIVKELIDSIFTFDWRNRPNIVAVRNHPWVRG